MQQNLTEISFNDLHRFLGMSVLFVSQTDDTQLLLHLTERSDGYIFGVREKGNNKNGYAIREDKGQPPETKVYLIE